MKTLMLGLVLMAPTLRAEDTTGDTWLKWDDLARLTYIEGVHNGMVGKPGYFDYFPRTHTTFLSLVDELNQFYAEPANRPIGVMLALRVASQKFNGGSKYCIVLMTMFYRILASATELTNPQFKAAGAKMREGCFASK